MRTGAILVAALASLGAVLAAAAPLRAQTTPAAAGASAPPLALPAPPEPVPRPGRGRLRVAVNRPNTEVFVDDHFAGVAPIEQDLPAGIHSVRITSPGQKSWRGTVEVMAEMLNPLRVFLRPEPVRDGGWATLGVASAIFAGAIVVGALSNADQTGLAADRMAGFADNHDPRIDRGTALAVGADAGFVLGGIVTALGIYMLAHDPTPPSIGRLGRRERLVAPPPPPVETGASSAPPASAAPPAATTAPTSPTGTPAAMGSSSTPAPSAAGGAR